MTPGLHGEERNSHAVLASMALLTASAALAESKWKGSGWYQVADTVMVGYSIVAGPFGTKEACESTLPQDLKDESYSCRYLEEMPDWSE